MKRYATRFSAWSSTRRLRIAACTETSSADVGSSQTTSFGSPANARAIATRCLRPPESWTGFCVSVRSVRRTRAVRSCTRASAAAPPTPASFCIDRSRIRRTEWRRFSAESGFWNTICSARSSLARALLVPGRRARGRRGSPCPSSAGRCRGAFARASSSRSPTRRRGQASHPARSAALTSVSAWTSWPRCLKTFASSSSSTSGRPPRGRRRGARCRRPPRAAGRGLLVVPAAALVSGRRPSLERRLLRATALVGERAAIGEHAAGELGAEAAAGSRGSCRAGRDPSGRRRAGCSGAGRPCTGAADPAAPSRPGPSSTSRPA